MIEQFIMFFKEKCYEIKEGKRVLKADLQACSKTVLESITERDTLTEVFKSMEKEIDFENSSIVQGSELEKLVKNNIDLEERFLPIVPSMKINNQILMVRKLN